MSGLVELRDCPDAEMWSCSSKDCKDGCRRQRPVAHSSKPIAPAHHWYAIGRMFRANSDTLQIARFLNLSEAEAYNALPLAMEQAR